MQNLSPTNIGAFQKMKRMFQMAFHFLKCLVFFAPMIAIGGYVPHEKEKKEKKTMPMFPMNLGDMTIILIIVKLSPQISNILCQNFHMTKYNIFSNFKNMHKHLKYKINKIMVR